MAFANSVFREGGSNNKPHLFICEYYDFWKTHSQAYLEEQGEEIWNNVKPVLSFPQVLLMKFVHPRSKVLGIMMIKRKFSLARRKRVCFNHPYIWLNSFMALIVR